MQSQYVRAIFVSSLFVALGVFAHPARVQCQWNTSGNNISNSNTGNVGVGTASPIEALHVAKGDANGTVAIFQKDTSSSAVAISTTNNKGSVSGTNSNATATGDLLLNPFGGNIGIGTTTPDKLLTVQGSSNRRTLKLISDGDSVGYSGIDLVALTNTNISDTRAADFFLSMRKDTWYGGDGSGPSFIIETGSKSGNNFSAPFTITPTNDILLNSGKGVSGMPVGNVGIGRGAPAAKMYVAGGGYGSVGNANQSIYAFGAQSIAADASIYSYGAICAGNGLGNCTGGGGVVLGTNNSSAAVNIPNSGNTIFNNGGSVGIGTTGPGFKLDVQGGQINASGGLCIAGTCKTSWSQVGGVSQWADGTNSISYSSGNVGIGTTSPGAALEVVGNIILGKTQAGGATLSLRRNDNAQCTTVGYLATDVSGLANCNGEIRLNAVNTNSANLITFLTANTERMRIDNSGNVGIGTTTPSTKLQVSAGDSSFALFGPNTTWGGSLAVGSGAAFVSPIAARAQVLSSNGNLHLDAGTGQNVYIGWLTQSNTIINGQSGNVGIGTTSPGAGYKLDVNGNTNVTGNMNVTGTVNAKYQDVAEWVPSSEQLAAGTVVVLDSTKANQVVASTTAYDTRVAGVISAQPGITLGEKSDSKVLVATTGRVRVKVDASRGAIAIGDLLVTSDVPGVAMKSIPVEFAGRKMHMPGTIIGKALEPLAKGKGELLVLLSLQ